MLANVGSNYLASGKEGGRYGNGHASIVPYTTYPTGDGMMAIAVGNDTQFAKMSAVLGHPEWAQDERFARNRDRVANREAADGMIADALRRDRIATWVERLQAVGVPCGPINSVSQALNDPHTEARRMVE